MVCKEHGKGDCRRRSVTYQTTCDTCRARNAAAGVENTPENGLTGASHIARQRNDLRNISMTSELRRKTATCGNISSWSILMRRSPSP